MLLVGAAPLSCQVEGCGASLKGLKDYHQVGAGRSWRSLD